MVNNINKIYPRPIRHLDGDLRVSVGTFDCLLTSGFALQQLQL